MFSVWLGYWRTQLIERMIEMFKDHASGSVQRNNRIPYLLAAVTGARTGTFLQYSAQLLRHLLKTDRFRCVTEHPKAATTERLKSGHLG